MKIINEEKQVGILTLCRSLNYGAYLQAYAMQKYLFELGYKVEFLNIYNFEETFKLLRGVLRRQTKDIGEISFNFKKFHIFRKAWRKLNISPDVYFRKRPEYSSIVIGSDEIWNIKNGTFCAFPEFYANGLNSKRIIAYAPGAASTDLELTKNHEYIAAGIKCFSSLSARDNNSQSIAEYYSGRKVPLVLDPTFLVTYEDEMVHTELNSYLLIYSYNFPKQYRSVVREFALRNGLKTVSVGFYSDWCDINLNVSPFEFLGLVRAADYVVTDTFHGSIFSVLLKKNVAIFGVDKVKVLNLLKTIGCASKIVKEGDSIDKILMSSYRDEVWKNIDKLKILSKQYLSNALGGCLKTNSGNPLILQN